LFFSVQVLSNKYLQIGIEGNQMGIGMEITSSNGGIGNVKMYSYMLMWIRHADVNQPSLVSTIELLLLLFSYVTMVIK